MKSIAAVIVAAVVGLSLAPPADASSDITAALAVRAERYVARDGSDGLAIAVVRCGMTAFVARGLGDREARRAVTPDTLFDIGSVSKSITGLLLAHAVAAKRVRLEDDVRRYLPGNYPNLQWSDGTPITLGQLADTTSGLPDFLPDPAPLAKLAADQQIAAASAMLRDYGNHDFLKDLHGIKLRSKPGTESRHSNVAAQLLGYLMSRVFGMPFGTALYRIVEHPAGMRDGTSASGSTTVAVGYDDRHRIMPPYAGESIMPAGGLRYTARDMGRFLRLLLSRDSPPVLVSQRVRFTADPDRQLALAWIVSEPIPGVKKYRMSGGTFGGSSYVEYYPSLGYGVALMANRAGANTQDELQEIAEQAFEAEGDSLRTCHTR